MRHWHPNQTRLILATLVWAMICLAILFKGIDIILRKKK